MGRTIFSWFVAVAAAAVLSGLPVAAQETGLPGGATSLREVHGDWVVSCNMATEGNQSRKICTTSQEQQEQSSGRRIVAIEVQPAADGNNATLVLPFGLDLAAGTVLQIDDGERRQALPFRTCLPAGCIVSFDVDADLLAALRSGTTLRIVAKADGGKETPFSLSLRGFGGALDRATSLAK
ncbi:invasion associated locus B family protein [Neorhizobium sp. DT-125]|uniref:invasion associated locus B family protein n=1 Tax=Neorhizobium sp. DT-125 TaxID=3396163 RepID=UPI003F1CC4D9